ncbi:MAG: VanZ family protein [Polyangiaceae bacterium]|nr:VanZ family protein [Polyangiaceae bacterium]MCW5791056.1 VanZ family protein [Polyangiaceae bacterium]
MIEPEKATQQARATDAPRSSWFGWLLIAGYVVGVLVLGLTPGPQLNLGDTWVPQDKLGHLVVFAGFAALLTAVLRGRRRALLGVLGSTSLGGALELLQALVPYRSAELLDLVADAVGAVLGAGLVGIVRSLRSVN